MNGELFIIGQLLLSRSTDISTPAYEFLSGELDTTSPDATRAALGNRETVAKLAQRLECEPYEVFDRVAALTAREEPTLQQSLKLEFEDLTRVMATAARSRLGAVLARPDADVLDALFDRERLRRVLEGAGAAVAKGERDVDSLLLRIFERRRALESRWGLTSSAGWGQRLDRDRWVLPAAQKRLELHTRHAPGLTTSQMLVLVIARPVTAPRYVPEFDMLAVSELQRRVSLLASSLLNEATRLAEQAAQLSPEDAVLARLRPWIDLYESQTVRRGLTALLDTGVRPLREVVRGIKPVHVGGELVSDEPLMVRDDGGTEAPQPRLRVLRRRADPGMLYAFDVRARVVSEDEPIAIAKATGVPQADFERIRPIIERLCGRDLAARGRDLGVRLLNTEVPTSRGLAGLLRAAVGEYDGDFIRALLLSGRRDPVRSDVAWSRDLNDRLDEVIAPEAPDSSFPVDARALADDLRHELESAGRTVRRVAL